MAKSIGIATTALLLCLTVPGTAQPPELQITTSPQALHVTANGAIIEWNTNLPASTLVRYGTDHNHLDQSTESTGHGPFHSVRLYNLRSGTTYFYQVVSSANGTSAITYVNQFSTLGEFVPYYTLPTEPPSR